MQTNKSNDQALAINKITTGDQLRLLFVKNQELNPWGAYQLLKQTPAFKGGYQWVRKLFYCAKRLGLIIFVREEKGEALVPKRIYKIVPGFEDDPRWHNLHSALYPNSAIGALLYPEKKSEEDANE